MGRVAPLNARTCDQNVDVVIIPNDRPRESINAGLIGKISCVDERLATQILDFPFGILVGLVALDEDNIRTCARKCKGHGLTNPSSASCDQRQMAIK